jgi:small GTP-binding protein
MQEHTLIFKIAVGGAGGVGKTTLLLRYLQGVFKTDTGLTVGVNFYTKDIIRPDNRVKLAIWDLGGQERFRIVHPQFVLGAKAAILFFDMSRLQTMTQIDNWVSLFRTSTTPDIPILLCGTKQDLLTPDAIEEVRNQAMSIVEKQGFINYFPTSSKDGLNVDVIFDQIIDLLTTQAQAHVFVKSGIMTRNEVS